MKIVGGFLKWLLAGILGLIAGLLVYIFVSSNLIDKPLLLRLTVLAVISLVNAIFVRMLLNRTWSLAQVLIVLLSSTLIVISLDRYLSVSEYQFDFSAAINSLDTLLEFQTPSIRDASQLLYLLLASLPILLLGRRKKTRLKSAGNSSKPTFKTDLLAGWKRFTYRVNPTNWEVWNKLSSGSSTKSRTVSRTSTRPAAPPVQVSAPKSSGTHHIKKSRNKAPVIKSTKSKLRLPGKLFQVGNNHDVKLTGSEDHVCPYCLEEIHSGDPLGIVICKECGTWHHQDCWNLTGACGVAHRNQL